MSLGADDFIPQPYSISEINEAIHALIQRSIYPQRTAQLTESPSNESLTQSELQQQFSQLQQNVSHPEVTNTLYLLGIDQLNWFRNTLGTQVSNSVIDTLETRLINVNQALGDIFFIAKIDHQQFAILPRPGLELQARDVLNPAWQQSLSQPVSIQDEELLITMSIAAIEFSMEEECDFVLLMSQAKQLLKHLNAQGGNQFCIDWFCTATQSSREFAIATNLLRGLNNNEFHAYYQPQVDLKTGRFVGVEALVRWHHHDWGTLDPGQFIPVAEETGSIIQIDERVLRRACFAAKKWQDAGYEPPRVSVNLSAYSFNRPNLSEVVQDTLREFSLSPQWIELEITESALVQDKQRAAKIMNELKSVGVSIALDDFGVGYSSLSYLQQFPLDTLKIDQSFIQKVDTNRGNAAITEAVIELAHSLNLTVIAEGVERVEEREFLKQRRCDVMQGFLISPPVPECVFESFLTAQAPVMQIV